MLEALLILPLLAAALMMIITRAATGRTLLVAAAILHAVLTAAVLRRIIEGNAPSAFGGLLAPDMLGGLFLGIASALFLVSSIYAVGYLKAEKGLGERAHMKTGERFTNAPERRFTACLCIFLSAMTLVTCTRHLGALWVGIEATTLASAPLIYFHRHRESLEATWKYLIICSVGIALALIGNLLLSLAFAGNGLESANEAADQLSVLQKLAHGVTPGDPAVPWLKAAFIFFLVGYGTKMGLAPLHNWLPDAHSQAPSLVSALLSGALLNCALLGILRGHQILLAAGLGGFSARLLLFFGLLSLITAAIFIVGQGHYKRLLAYSSVEHMGILAFGIGLGGVAVQGAMLHALCHSLTKCMLFLLAGNILTRYHTLSSYDVRGMRWSMPFTTVLWAGGFLAIVGSPPFGLFVSELWIFKGALAQGQWLVGTLYMVLLAVIFVGMSVPVLRMIQGSRPPDVPRATREPLLSVLPPLALGLTVLLLGLYVPQGLRHVLAQAARSIGG